MLIFVIQIECGAQFSLALSKTGVVWTWGKGDYFRLGHGADQHVRKPTVVESLEMEDIKEVREVKKDVRRRIRSCSGVKCQV